MCFLMRNIRKSAVIAVMGIRRLLSVIIFAEMYEEKVRKAIKASNN